MITFTLGSAHVAHATVASATDGDDEALYQQRFAALTRDRGVVSTYDPVEAVPGAVNPTPLPVAPAAARTIRAEALATASAYAAASHATAFLVWHHGTLQTAVYGEGVTAATPLVSKSLSKPLAAIAVGRAIALGKIASLDEPVADFVPEWRNTPKAAILVRHLLDMRSGLMEQTVSANPDHPVNRAYISPDHGRYLVEHYPLVALPGTRYGYSNATADLVAVLIERSTGRRYAEFVGREVLAPIGAAGGDIWVDRPGGTAHSGCCMHLPAGSWLRLGILLASDGVAHGRRLLPQGYVAAMATPTAENPHYGLGVWVAGPYVARRGFTGDGGGGPQVLHGAPYLDRDLFLFDGNGDQVVYVSRAASLVIARLGDAPPKTPEWDNAVLPNVLIAGIVAAPGAIAPVPQAATAVGQKP